MGFVFVLFVHTLGCKAVCLDIFCWVGISGDTLGGDTVFVEAFVSVMSFEIVLDNVDSCIAGIKGRDSSCFNIVANFSRALRVVFPTSNVGIEAGTG